MLFLISFIYYTFESVSGIGIGSKIFGFRVIAKYELPSQKILTLYITRNLVKSFFVSNALNGLFVLAFRRNMQTLLDRGLYVIITTEKDPQSKTFRQGILNSAIMYYSSFMLMTITFALENYGLASSPSSPTGSSGVSGFSLFQSLLNNNLTLDLTGFVLGGLSVMFGTFLRLFISNILDTIVISSVLSPKEFPTLIHYFLPEFLPETMGYVFGIAAAISIANIILYYIQALLRNEKKEYFFSTIKIHLKNFAYYLCISVVLIFIGAIIESIVVP